MMFPPNLQYIPEKSSPNIQKAVSALVEIAEAFDAAAAKNQSDLFQKQRSLTKIFRDLAADARDVIGNIDKQDISATMHTMTSMSGIFMMASFDAGLPKQMGTLSPTSLGDKMSGVSDLLLEEFFRLRDARFDDTLKQGPKI